MVDVWVLARLAATGIVLWLLVPRVPFAAAAIAALLLFEHLWYLVGLVLKGRLHDGGLRLVVLTFVSYVTVALLFAVFYTALKFRGRFDAAYFSFVTLGTIGFGDIFPTTRALKSIVIAEHLVGVFYFAVVLVVIVGLTRGIIDKTA